MSEDNSGLVFFKTVRKRLLQDHVNILFLQELNAFAGGFVLQEGLLVPPGHLAILELK